MEEGEERNLE